MALYGDIWAQPMESRYGADAAARIAGKVDIYTGGMVDTEDSLWQASAGVKYRF